MASAKLELFLAETSQSYSLSDDSDFNQRGDAGCGDENSSSYGGYDDEEESCDEDNRVGKFRSPMTRSQQPANTSSYDQHPSVKPHHCNAEGSDYDDDRYPEGAIVHEIVHPLPSSARPKKVCACYFLV